jgi:hypothetical protein
MCTGQICVSTQNPDFPLINKYQYICIVGHLKAEIHGNLTVQTIRNKKI